MSGFVLLAEATIVWSAPSSSSAAGQCSPQRGLLVERRKLHRSPSHTAEQALSALRLQPSKLGALAVVREIQPRVRDLPLGRAHGFELHRKAREQHPGVRPVVPTAVADVADIGLNGLDVHADVLELGDDALRALVSVVQGARATPDVGDERREELGALLEVGAGFVTLRTEGGVEGAVVWGGVDAAVERLFGRLFGMPGDGQVARLVAVERTIGR